MKRSFLLLSIAALALMMIACKKEKGELKYDLKVLGVTDITRNSAILHGSFTGEGATEGAEHGFEVYGSFNGGYETKTFPVDGDGEFSLELTDLGTLSDYKYRAYAIIGGEKILVPAFAKEEPKSFRTFSYDGYTLYRNAVDLGTGVKWSTCNLDALYWYNPGFHYAWGETSTKTDYSEETYTYHDIPEGLVLPLDHDAANVKLGGTFRMPTEEEWRSLKDQCTWVWKTTDDGYSCSGYLVSGGSANIFLPAAGRRRGLDFSFKNSRGYYWTSSLSYYEHMEGVRNDGFFFGLAKDRINIDNTDRYVGFSIRPVCD